MSRLNDIYKLFLRIIWDKCYCRNKSCKILIESQTVHWELFYFSQTTRWLILNFIQICICLIINLSMNNWALNMYILDTMLGTMLFFNSFNNAWIRDDYSHFTYGEDKTQCLICQNSLNWGK